MVMRDDGPRAVFESRGSGGQSWWRCARDGSVTSDKSNSPPEKERMTLTMMDFLIRILKERKNETCGILSLLSCALGAW